MLIAISSCKKSNDSCVHKPTETYLLPNNFYSWLDKVTAPGTSINTLTFKSNTGLTDQVTVIRDTSKYMANISDCESQAFQGLRCTYTSSSGEDLFQLHLSWDFVAYPGYLSTIPVYETVDRNRISLWIYFDSQEGQSDIGTKLTQTISPVGNILKTTRYVRNVSPKNASASFCDTCITTPGTYILNGKTYTDVSLYTYPEPTAYSRFIIDKYYGVIGFTRNGVNWTLE